MPDDLIAKSETNLISVGVFQTTRGSSQHTLDPEIDWGPLCGRRGGERVTEIMYYPTL